MYQGVLAVAFSFIIDYLIGDPQYSFHPIRLIGNLIAWVEKALRPTAKENPQKLVFTGAMTVATVIIITAIMVYALLYIASLFGDITLFVVQVILSYTVLSMGSLRDESMKVYHKLKEEDTEGARYAVSMIVGRDTKSLDEKGITKAAVETVAENTADGVVAPLLYLILFGPIGGFVYKAINTMDSMLGYKNDKYINFGKCAARLDDVVGYIPARLTAYMMILSASFIGLDSKNALKIYKRDKHNHASPNSAHSEAACAGALSIMLAGDAYYFGKLYKKPTIGDNNRDIEYEDIRRANNLMIISSFFTLVFTAAFAVAINLLLAAILPLI